MESKASMEIKRVLGFGRDRRMARRRGAALAVAAVLALTAAPALAEQHDGLDFGWSKPVAPRAKGRKTAPYLLWPIQVMNNTGGVLTPSVSVVAVTNTGRQYTPLPYAAVAPDGPYEQLYTLDGLRTELFPQATRRAVAVFERVDPNAREIRFYVSGLVRPGARRASAGPASGGNPYVMVTFERVKDEWQWVNTEFLE
jgi:hypothetical protein